MSLASDVGRLEVLQSTQLLDSEPEPAFDRLTRLAANLLGAPTALVSLVDAHRQFFKSAFGLTGQLARDRETPLSHSFCKYVARDRAPLVVGDARQHPVLRNSPAIRDYSVIAYAGIPLVVEDEAIGAFCVVDDKPREWSPDKIQVLQDLADSVVSGRSPTRSSPRTTSPTGGARRWSCARRVTLTPSNRRCSIPRSRTSRMASRSSTRRAGSWSPIGRSPRCWRCGSIKS